jgi:hypothetical protein
MSRVPNKSKANTIPSLFQCSSQSETRKETIQKLDKKDQNLYNLFMDKTGQKQLITFLKESKIATRKWVFVRG